MLRALKVEAGEHEVVLSFLPRSVDTTETIAYASFGILLLLVLLIAGWQWRSRKK